MALHPNPLQQKLLHQLSPHLRLAALYDAVSPSPDSMMSLSEELNNTGWLPIFIRPGITHWAHSQLNPRHTDLLKGVLSPIK